MLGLIDAALGNKKQAQREARRAVELLPIEKDAINGALMIKYSAMIAAWVGDKDLACQQLAITIRDHGFLSYGQLKLYRFGIRCVAIRVSKRWSHRSLRNKRR